MNYYGDLSAWYSVKPKEYDMLKNFSPIEQVAGQVYYTNLAIAEGLETISDTQSLSIEYESFCKQPEIAYAKIREKFYEQGVVLEETYTGVESFKSTNQVNLPKNDQEEIIRAFEKFSGERFSF